MKKWNPKMSGFLYGILLLSYTGYALLDSFVIPHPMQTVVASSQQSNSQSTLAESVEAQINQKLNSTEAESSAQVSDPTKLNQTETQTDASTSSSLEGTAIGNYSDSKTKITLTKYRSYDSSIYVADVTVSDVSDLKTAFAQNTYGRNITEQTSSMASDHQAVLAINGDYYGARQSGYVIRNGQLYRDSSGGNTAAAILSNGDFQFVTEGETSADTLLQDGALQVFSFGPVLLKEGNISVSENEEVGMAMASNPRTAIGRIGKNHYVFVVSDGRTEESAGLSLYELASFMKELGVTDAYNLDGGGSSTMVFQGNIINNPTTNGHSFEERAVSDILYIGGKNT